MKMSSYTLTILFGVALVQALPTLKTDKLQSELRDWSNETKIDDESVDIKQGNRTKKSVICLDLGLLNNGDCPPGCGEQHQEPQITAPQPPSMQQFMPSPPIMMPAPPQPPRVPQFMPSPPIMMPAPAQPPSAPQFIPSPPIMVQAPAQPPRVPQFLPSPPIMVQAPAQPPRVPQFMPSPPIMVQAPAQPPSAPQFMPSPPIMVQAPAQPPSAPQFMPSPPIMVQAPAQPPSAPQFMPSPPVMMPVPQLQLTMPPAVQPPQVVQQIPQLPPCPPEQQFVIPGTESEEVISYEMVPVSHHIPSSPPQVITTPRPPYPCIPAGQSQSLPQAPPATSLTSMQQQHILNQVQVVQGNSYPASSGNQQYPSPSGNVQMIQMPSSNPSYYHQSPQSSGPMYLPQQPSSYPSSNQYAGPSSQYHQPTMISPSNFVQVSPIQNGGQSSQYHQLTMISPPDCVPGIGYQASQSVAQSYAAAQSAAINSFGLPPFRSADDADDESRLYMVAAANATSPLTNSNNQGYTVPSSRYSSHNVIQRLPRSGISENGQVKRESSKKGIEKKVKFNYKKENTE